jgi:hypothetical protein
MTTKTETKDTNQTNSIPNPFAGFDPMATWTASQETFRKMVAEAFGRFESAQRDYATLEAQMIARAHTAVANWAQLAQDAIAYGAQLSEQARKLGIETARKFGTVGA